MAKSHEGGIVSRGAACRPVLIMHGPDPGFPWDAAVGRHCRGQRQGSRASTCSTKIL